MKDYIDFKTQTWKVMCDLYDYLKSDKGVDIIIAGWRASEILDAVEKGRGGQFPNLDPYVCWVLRSF